MTDWNGTRWVPDVSTTRGAPRIRGRFLGAFAEALLVVMLLFGLIASAALAAPPAGKGGGGGSKDDRNTASMTMVVLDGSDATANHGERITFSVSTKATDRPFVSLKCWQGATGVYNKSIGVFSSYLYDPWFTLDSMYWTAGAEASCTAAAYHYDKRGRQTSLTTMEVAVAP